MAVPTCNRSAARATRASHGSAAIHSGSSQRSGTGVLCVQATSIPPTPWAPTRPGRRAGEAAFPFSGAKVSAR
jgi:hypothetical protein